jgi:hypothetical protein
VRIDCREWISLNPEDVAWVAEWQLVAAAPWLPLRDGGAAVVADPLPDPGGRTWRVTVRLGLGGFTAHLRVRDLARIIRWCYHVGQGAALERPPAFVRGSMLTLRRPLRKAALSQDPLNMMGYDQGDPRGRGPVR